MVGFLLMRSFLLGAGFSRVFRYLSSSVATMSELQTQGAGEYM
jgi:hypothetical protein